MKKCVLYLLLLTLLAGSACSKDGAVDGDAAGRQSIIGQLFFQNHDGHSMISLPSMKETIWKENVTAYNWDVSRDGKHIMELRNGRYDGMPDQVKFTFKEFAAEGYIHEFFYRPLKGGTVFVGGQLSPDKSLFCINATFEEGLVILKTDGTGVVGHLEAIEGEAVGRNISYCWLPDNSLVIGWKNQLVRLSPPYNTGELLKQMPNEDYAQLEANRTGTQLAMVLDNHIWLLDIASGDLRQVTNSQAHETSPCFSPDGKYLVIGTDLTTIGTPGNVPSYQSYMKIVPLDGKLYDLDQTGNGVIPVIAQGERSAEPLKGAVVWTD